MFRLASVLRCASQARFASRKANLLFNPTAEHEQLRTLAASFAKDKIGPQASEFDKKGLLNRSLLRQVGEELGLLGITIPADHGGAGMDATAAVIVHHEFAKYDPGFTLAYLAHSMLFVNNFFHGANEDQRKRYLSKVISGEFVGAMGMTEPGAGTDVLGLQTTAVKKGDDYVLNGSKTFITNGVEADVFLIYAKLNGRITSFIVERTSKGFSTSGSIDKVGMRGSSMATLFFEDVVVPKKNLLGVEGGGLVHMMRNLEIERLTLAAMSVGIAERSFELMLDYAESRKAFGQSINSFGQVQRYIADGYALTEAAKAFVYNVARDVSANVENRINTDAVKLFAAPVGKIVADYAIQVMGGAGYCREYVVERLWRDAKLLEIGGGTLEAHQKNMTKDMTKKWKAGQEF